MDGQQALKVLQKAGTSRDYPGLWRDVEGYTRPAVNEALPDLVAEAQTDSVAATMAKLDRVSDNLKASQAVKWTVPEDHPDLVPSEEAERVIEGLEATLGHISGDYDNPEFRTWLTGSIEAARQFEAAIRAGPPDAATSHFNRLQQSCKTCHTKYRDK